MNQDQKIKDQEKLINNMEEALSSQYGMVSRLVHEGRDKDREIRFLKALIYGYKEFMDKSKFEWIKFAFKNLFRSDN